MVCYALLFGEKYTALVNLRKPAVFIFESTESIEPSGIAELTENAFNERLFELRTLDKNSRQIYPPPKSEIIPPLQDMY